MDLRGFLEVVRRRFGIIIATALVSVGAAFVFRLLSPPTYLASATLRLATPVSSEAGRFHLDYADRLMNTFSHLVSSGWARRELVRSFDPDSLPTFEAEILANTELLRVTVSHRDPEVATEAANSLTALLQATSRQWGTSGSPRGAEAPAAQAPAAADSPSPEAVAEAPAGAAGPPAAADQAAPAEAVTPEQVASSAAAGAAAASAGLAGPVAAAPVFLEVVEPAVEPVDPAGPGRVTLAGLALALGLAGGLGLGFLRDGLDPTLHDPVQMAVVTGSRVLAEIPRMVRLGEGAATEQDERVVEEFRRLQFGLNGKVRSNDFKTVLVTSAEAGEGKSTVVTLLAVAAAREGLCVLAVDYDLRSPTLHRAFKLKQRATGLGSAVGNELAIAELVRPSGIPGLDVLPAGLFPVGHSSGPPPDSVAVMLEPLRTKYDLILIDTPPLRDVASALGLAPRVDGVVLVAAAGYSRKGTVRRAADLLLDSGSNLLGVVATRVSSHWRAA